MKLLGVFGAGGFGRGVIPLVDAHPSKDAEVVFVDDHCADTSVNGYRVMSFSSFSAHSNREMCLAVADAQTRKSLAIRCQKANIGFFSIKSFHHVELDKTEIGEGAILCPYTILTSNVRIGSHFHLNIYSYVEHDCVIGDFVTFAPAVRCNGNVTIEDGAYLGSGAVLRQGVRIGAGATVGMGAVVTRDVPPGEIWVGNPARKLVR